jgi:hypothetical protein
MLLLRIGDARNRKGGGLDSWERRQDRTCPHCGAPNWPDATRCVSCGATLNPPEISREEEIIDVTGGEPQRVTDPQHPRASGLPDMVSVERNRVFVASGRGCLIGLILLLLSSCCVCWVLWSGVSRLNWL